MSVRLRSVPAQRRATKIVSPSAHQFSPRLVSVYEELWADVQPESSRRLLISALEAFATSGFAGSTTRQIAEGAGLSPTGVYVHYRSKSDLLFEVVRLSHESVLADVQAVTEAVDDAPAKLRSFVETFVIFHARYHTLGFVGEYELRSLEGEQLTTITRLRHAYRQLVERILLQGIASGDFDVTDLRGTARTILSLGTDVARWFRAEGSLTPEDVADLHVDLVLRMVQRVPTV